MSIGTTIEHAVLGRAILEGAPDEIVTVGLIGEGLRGRANAALCENDDVGAMKANEAYDRREAVGTAVTDVRRENFHRARSSEVIDACQADSRRVRVAVLLL